MEQIVTQAQRLSSVRKWLWLIAFLIFCMILIGGATRLTDSGLSITEWKPILGAVPPLNDLDWNVAFEKYKQIPEYKIQNSNMTLNEFKVIYWWEWGHRQFGRFIGLVFAVPFLFFAVTRRFDRKTFMWSLVLLLLGAAQAGMGWFMVKSGLTVRTDVSQYRLAAHLGLAALIFALTTWTALGAGFKRKFAVGGVHAYFSLLLLIFVLLQIVAGGFVAGLDAGMGYNTWPKMDGDYLPEGLLVMQPTWRNFFENTLTVQFVHRLLAYALLALAVIHAFWSFRASSMMLAYAIFAQAAIGILTLLMNVPLPLALLHQGLAMLVLLIAVWNLHRQTQLIEFNYG